jgi:hypothetical protein
MPRSLVRGDYSLIIAIESSSRPNSWYRVLADRQTGLVSCDCPPWVFNRQHDAEGKRTCQHTDFANLLATETRTQDGTVHSTTASPLLTATQQQWPGLRGNWHIEQADTSIRTSPYHVVLLRLDMGNGGTATGVVAFATQHHHTETEMIGGVAGWAGYAIAAEVARLGNFPLVGQLPEHFRIDRRPTSSRRQQPTTSAIPSIGLADILRVGDIVDQGDGLTPRQRSTRTLRFFLGEETFQILERQGFLDIPSMRYTREQRVYRLRRDPVQQRQRRIRVFQRGEYWKDFCVVLAQECPPDDLFLTAMLGLLSDETDLLSVVNPNYNIFPPYSDGTERETVPAVWIPRQAAAPVA